MDFSDLEKEICRFEGKRKIAVEKGYDSNMDSDQMLEGLKKTNICSRHGPKA